MYIVYLIIKHNTFAVSVNLYNEDKYKFTQMIA